ncbi:MAG: hypothetical protein J6S26_01425 [Solobacterium sp.]|nr:hypothetical protein [Solobacterium sp.]
MRNQFLKSIQKRKRMKWYSITALNDPDGIGQDSIQILVKGRELGIRCGWFQLQGTRFYGMHCTREEAKRLIHALGETDYRYHKMMCLEKRFLKNDIGWPY